MVTVDANCVLMGLDTDLRALEPYSRLDPGSAPRGDEQPVPGLGDVDACESAELEGGKEGRDWLKGFVWKGWGKVGVRRW